MHTFIINKQSAESVDPDGFYKDEERTSFILFSAAVYRMAGLFFLVLMFVSELNLCSHNQDVENIIKTLKKILFRRGW